MAIIGPDGHVYKSPTTPNEVPQRMTADDLAEEALKGIDNATAVIAQEKLKDK